MVVDHQDPLSHLTVLNICFRSKIRILVCRGNQSRSYKFCHKITNEPISTVRQNNFEWSVLIGRLEL